MWFDKAPLWLSTFALEVDLPFFFLSFPSFYFPVPSLPFSSFLCTPNHSPPDLPPNPARRYVSFPAELGEEPRPQTHFDEFMALKSISRQHLSQRFGVGGERAVEPANPLKYGHDLLVNQPTANRIKWRPLFLAFIIFDIL